MENLALYIGTDSAVFPDKRHTSKNKKEMIKDMSQEKKNKYNWVIFTIQHAKGKRKRTRNISCGRQRKDRSPTKYIQATHIQLQQVDLKL